MLRVMMFSAVFALLAVPASAYSSRCVQPYAPTVPDGRAATKAQIDSSKAQVIDFIKQSDQYQECLILEIKTERAKAERKGKQFDTQIEIDLRAVGNANQREKERVGAEFNGASHTYYELHPKTQ